MAFVYRFKDKNTQEVIYVGKTKRSLEARMREHFGDKGHLPPKCYESVGAIEYMPMRTEADALLFENYFINKYKPIYNVKDKVDSVLTYDMKIKENWRLLCIMNEKQARFSIDVFTILFWGSFIYFLILTIIGLYF